MTGASEPLLDSNTRVKVSSTLDRSVGKKHLTDGSPETCWTSQQGLPQYINIIFDAPVIPKTVHLTFQGGFVGKRCRLDILPATSKDEDNLKPTLESLTTIYPEDVNWKQSFSLPKTDAIRQLNLVFEESSDFFGRITIYDLQIRGQVVQEE